MANLTPTPGWDEVFQLETDTPVLGGAGGPDNLQAQALLNRFSFLEGPEGSGKLGYTPAGPGAVATTIKDWLDQWNTVKNFGASPSADSGVNAAAIQQAINFLPENGVLDLGGNIYPVNVAIVINKRMRLQNGILRQVTETENVVEVPGPLAAGPTLKNVRLVHDFFTANAGSLLDLSAAGNVGFFEWDGSLGICTGGFYGVRSHGGTFMMRFKRIYINDIYSSGFYLPASGDVVNASALGGSTTTLLTTCFVSRIRTSAPAFAIGAGYDTVRLENCAADSVSNFGFFKCQPLQIVNCSAENIRNPIIGTLAGPHRFITINSGAGQEINGFACTFDPSFVAPAPGGGNVNSLVYCANASNLHLAGMRGGLPAGYRMLDLEGGKAIINSAILGDGIRVTAGGSYIEPGKSVAISAPTHRFDRFTTVGDVAEYAFNGSVVGATTIEASNLVSFENKVNSASVALGARTAGGVVDRVYYNANVPAFFPIADNTNSLGRSTFRWSVVYAGTGTINTSDARLKQQDRPLYDAEKAVAIKIKSLFKAFKYNDAVNKKGEKARIHVGVYAQEVAQAFVSEGLDPNDYALFCYDKWEDEYEIILDEEGNDTGETKLIAAAGDRYGIRYEELLSFIIAAL